MSSGQTSASIDVRSVSDWVMLGGFALTSTALPQADLSLTKTDGALNYSKGGTVTYAIVVSNAGPDDAVGATVTDSFPSAIASASWTCTASPGASCTASGNGNLNDTVSIPVGKTVTYTVTASIAPNASGNLVNTATVAAPSGSTDPTPSNNSATDTDALLSSIGGQVFEDKDYGGGAGRSFSASSGVGRPGVRVERYTSTGSFVDFTTTDAAGNYSFPALSAGGFIVRVVNSTVKSSRLGANGSESGVQTYRTDASSGTPIPVTNKVGGEQPAKVDAPANTGTQTIATLQGLSGMYPQSISSVDTTSGDVIGVDFGFNFDTIVNTKDSGQGSLRQFIKNANLFTDDSSLNQAGRSPGRESSIFMIPTTDPNYSASPLAFTITPLSQLDTVTNPVVLDGTTQPGWTSAPIIQLSGGSAGSTANGLTISAGFSAVRGFVINKFKSDGVELATGGSNTVAGNFLGTNITGTSASANTRDGIYINGSANNVIGGTTPAERNIISGNTWVGIEILGAGSTGNLIQGNYVGLDVTGSLAVPNQNDGIDVAGGASGTTIGGDRKSVV
jgi:uncharacterized repeat protein (TIGR01451 family)